MTVETRNDTGHAAALGTTAELYERLVKSLAGDEPTITVGAAPAGGGKTHLVVDTLAQLLDLRPDIRIVVATPMNGQGAEIANRLVRRGVSFVRLPRKKDAGVRFTAPDGSPIGGVVDDYAEFFSSSSRVLIATTTKLVFTVASKKFSGHLDAADLLVVDEAYQVKAADYLTVGRISPRHLLVGDPGQLAPFTTVNRTTLRRGSKADPVRTAVEVASDREGEPGFSIHRFNLTRRLDRRALPLVKNFYPEVTLGAWSESGRTFTLDRPSPGSSAGLEAVLDTAAEHGFGYLALPGLAPGGPADPEVARSLVDLLAAIRGRNGRVTDDDLDGPPRVLIGVSRNAEGDLVRRELHARGLTGEADVLTANKAQGLEYDVVIVSHPLSGVEELSEFVLDTGRLAVLLTRHRHAVLVVGRETDRRHFDRLPPAAPVHPGEPDRVLAGWYAHRAVLDVLAPRETVETIDEVFQFREHDSVLP